MNIANILKLAEVLEREDTQKHFDLNNWAFNNYRFESFALVPYNEETLHKCGTVACIAGWGKAVFEPTTQDSPYEVGIRALDLDALQANELFTPVSDEWDVEVPEDCYVYDATARGAAKVLRHLAATGEVDWSKAFDE